MQNLPVTTKNTVVKMNDQVYVASSSMQGWREDMQDAHTILLQPPMDRSCIYVGLFDGHRGSSVANFARKYLHHEIFLQQEYSEGDIRGAIEQGFLALDKLMLDDPIINAEEAGSTALVILIKNGIIHCGNLGDSRAVAFVKGMPKKLSNDHRPNFPEELQRIQEAGCKLIHNRVNGRLAVSRSLGDFKYKRNNSLPPALQAVTGFPEVIIDIIESDWEFVLMASDGVFNAMSSEELITYIHTNIVQGVRPEDITERVLNHCLSPNPKGRGSDNMTLILILFMSNIEKDYVKKLMNLPESRSCPSPSQYFTCGSDPGPSTSKTD